MTKTTTSIAAKRNTTRTSSGTATRTSGTARSTSGTATRTSSNTATRTASTARSTSGTVRSTSGTATRTSGTARRSGTTTARRSASTRRASASKKGSGYNKYVPVFIDNYAEQRSAKLRAKLGWQAYGIYLAILQRLRSEKDCTLELDYESLALSFWTDEDNLRAIIEDFNLFAINRQEGTFYSPLLDSMLSTLDPSLAQSRAPLPPEPVENDEYSAVDDAEDGNDDAEDGNDDAEDCNEADACACFAEECEITEDEDDFSDENPALSDEKFDVIEKEFRVKEKEIEIFAPSFSEETATMRGADEVSIFESEKAQNRISLDGENDAELDAKNTQNDAAFDAQNDAQFDAQNDAQNDAEFDAEFDAKNSAKSDAKSVLQMCTNVLQEDTLQSDANEHFSTAAHARVNKQTNKRTNKQTTFGGKEESRRKLLLSPPSTAPKTMGRANVFVKPNEQNRACSSYAMARKGRMKSKDKKRRPVYLDPPTVEEVARYAESLGYAAFEAERFVAYYAANGWKTSRHDMVSWQAAVCNWQKNECRFAQEREQREQQQQQWQEQREARAQQWQAEREARFAAEQEWRKQHFLAKNGSQEEQDALFQQQRRNYLEQKVVEAVTSDEDKYALPPSVPF